MTGTADEYTRCCWRCMVFPRGKDDRFRPQRHVLVSRHRAAGLNSLVGTTVRDSAQLPEHLVADEHHADWAGQKGYIPTTVGGGWISGVALTASADDVHLQEAYGVFAAEARDVDPEYAPQTVNTDGWASTRVRVPDVVSPDHGGALFSARVLEDSRPLPQGPRTAPPGGGTSTVPPLRRSFDA